MLTRRNCLKLSLAAASLSATSLPIWAQTDQSLDFNPDAFEALTTTITTDAGEVLVTYRFYKAIPYVARPVDLAYQSLNISVPVEINGVAINATNAPILFANSVGGYMPSSVVDATGVGEAGMRGPTGGTPPTGVPATAASGSNAMLSQGKKISNAQRALAAGYVVVEPGARGRTLVDASGTYYGTAPAAIVDLKAAVRWLRHNAGKVPGNTEWIVSSGTSAGGALSTLLGATGDLPQYLPYLSALGAAETSDAIFATGAWCPITDLEHADMAYEWNWGSNPGLPGDPNSAMGNQIPAGGIDANLSSTLSAAFPAYQASLNLKGQGESPLTAETYGDHLLESFLLAEATRFLAAQTEADRAAYLAANPNITWDGTAANFTWPQFLAHVGPRKKNVPAFDAIDLTSGENNLFGMGTTQARHFTTFGLQTAMGDTTAQLDTDLGPIIALMNPMPALAASNPGRSKHWWFRLGAKDTDTSLSIVGNLDAQTRALGDNVSTRYYWDAGHGANEDATAFLAWIATVTGYTKG